MSFYLLKFILSLGEFFKVKYQYMRFYTGYNYHISSILCEGSKYKPDPLLITSLSLAKFYVVKEKSIA